MTYSGNLNDLGNLNQTLISLGAKPVRELFQMLGDTYTLSRTDRLQIIDQAMITIENMYCHLPLKLSRHPINPVQALKLLRSEVNDRPEESSFPTLDFHNAMVAIFNSLQDPHTSFIGPNYIAEYMTFLPFMMESFYEGEQEKGSKKYIVSRLLAGFEHDSFKEGVEIIDWNGTPVVDAVLKQTNDMNGGNHQANLALAQMSMTVRWLGSSILSKEKEVHISYISNNNDQSNNDQQIHRITLPWSFLKIDSAKIDFFDIRDFKIYDSINNTSVFQHLQRRHLFNPVSIDLKKNLKHKDGLNEAPIPVRESLKHIIEASTIRLPSTGEDKKHYGYIRLRSFICGSNEFIDGFKELLKRMPTDGLVIDLRGNPGGVISNAENLLQFLTPKEIKPLKFCYLATNLTKQLLEKDKKNFGSRAEWRASIGNSLATGALFTDAYSITPVQKANDHGQQYFGPVVVIVDAMTYSAAEMFTAGFADHSSGDIIFTDNTTGGGGASVMYHNDLLDILDDHPDLRGLPDSCRIRFALMRCDRENFGKSIEEFGVSSNEEKLKNRAYLHKTTKSDLFNDNIDLKKKAFELLGKKQPYVLALSTDPGPTKIDTLNIKYLNLYLDDRPLCAIDLSNAKEQISVPTDSKPQWKKCKAEGFDQRMSLVACLRFQK